MLPRHIAADSKAAWASHWNKVVGIPMLFRLDRAETGVTTHYAGIDLVNGYVASHPQPSQAVIRKAEEIEASPPAAVVVPHGLRVRGRSYQLQQSFLSDDTHVAVHRYDFETFAGIQCKQRSVVGYQVIRAASQCGAQDGAVVWIAGDSVTWRRRRNK